MVDRRGSLDDWPKNEEIEHLCKQADGLFAYAVAAVKFIGERNGDPRKRLNFLLRSPGGSKLAKGPFKTNTTIDSSYVSIFQEAFGDIDGSDGEISHATLVEAQPLYQESADNQRASVSGSSPLHLSRPINDKSLAFT